MRQTLYLGRFVSGNGMNYTDIRNFATEQKASCIMTFKTIHQKVKYYICHSGEEKQDVIIEAKGVNLEYAGDEDLFNSNFCTVCSKTVSGIPCDSERCPC